MNKKIKMTKIFKILMEGTQYLHQQQKVENL